MLSRINIALIVLIMCSSVFAQTAPNKKYILIGSTVKDVVAFLGNPSSYTPPDVGGDGRGFLYYGKAVITIEHGRVVKWKGFSPPKQANLSTNIFSLGTIRDEILFKMGYPPSAYLTPFVVEHPKRTIYNEEVWEYPDSTVIFLNGKLSGWKNVTTLHIAIGDKQSDTKPITLGSNRDALRMSAGMPSTLEPLTAEGYEVWQYGDDAIVFLQNGMVIGWINYKEKLPISLTIIPISVRKIELGSSIEDIIACSGTPQVILPKTDGGSIWLYDTNAIALDANNKISELPTIRLNSLLSKRQSVGLDWPNYICFLAGQAHLDYHDNIGLTDKEMYPLFINYKNKVAQQAASDRAKLMATDPAAAIRDDLAREKYKESVLWTMEQSASSNFIAGLRDRLDAELFPPTNAHDAAIADMNASLASQGKYYHDYAMGYGDVKASTNAAYLQYRTNYFVQIPDVIGKSINDVSAITDLQLEKITIRVPNLPSGTIIDSYPNAGYYLQKQGTLTLYVNQ